MSMADLFGFAGATLGATAAGAIVGAAAVMITVAIVYPELPRQKPPDPPPVAESIAVKNDPAPPPESHPVRTVPIIGMVVAPSLEQEREVVQDQSPSGRDKTRPPSHRAKTGADVCAKHGGQRVDDAGRRSWHCVFPKKAGR
jgi:hypothetical protein